MITATGVTRNHPEFKPYVYRGTKRDLTTRDRTRIRDVPARCACDWQYRQRPARWVRVAARAGCPWHAWHGPLSRKEAA